MGSDSGSPNHSAWEQIDHNLVCRKLRLLFDEMAVARKEKRAVIETANRANTNNAALWYHFFRAEKELANEEARRTFQLYCDVWTTQRQTKTPEFVRAVFERALVPLFRARASALRNEFETCVGRTGRGAASLPYQETAIRKEFARLQGRWADITESEASDCEHKRQADEEAATAAAHQQRKPGKKPRQDEPCYQAAIATLRDNPSQSPLQFAREMDRKADQFLQSAKYKPPASWKVRCFMEQYKKRPNTLSKFLTDLRKSL